MATTLQEIKNMALGGGQRHDWRLRTLNEEREIAASNAMVEGVEAFQKAFDLLEQGNQEGALAALRSARRYAEYATDTIGK